MLGSCFINVTLSLYENETEPWEFSKECSELFSEQLFNETPLNIVMGH